MKHFYLLLTCCALMFSCSTEPVEDNEKDPDPDGGPTACFELSDTVLAVGQDLEITDCSEGASTYLFDFGNGQTSTESDPEIEYEEGGQFTITLTVTNEDEETDVLKSHLSELEMCFAQKKPFYSYLHYGEIHHEVVRNLIRKYDDFSDEYFGQIDHNTERYRGYAAEAGAHTAELLRYIEEQDPSGNTFVIVLTDHGAGLGEKLGEKAYGIYTYDYSICVWLYLLWPKRLPQNQEIPCQIRSKLPNNKPSLQQKTTRVTMASQMQVCHQERFILHEWNNTSSRLLLR